MSERELKPCPFCGGEAQYQAVDADDTESGENAGGEFVECVDCHACTTLYFPAMQDVHEQVVAAWNKRSGR